MYSRICLNSRTCDPGTLCINNLCQLPKKGQPCNEQIPCKQPVQETDSIGRLLQFKINEKRLSCRNNQCVPFDPNLQLGDHCWDSDILNDLYYCSINNKVEQKKDLGETCAKYDECLKEFACIDNKCQKPIVSLSKEKESLYKIGSYCDPSTEIDPRFICDFDGATYSIKENKEDFSMNTNTASKYSIMTVIFLIIMLIFAIYYSHNL